MDGFTFTSISWTARSSMAVTVIVAPRLVPTNGFGGDTAMCTTGARKSSVLTLEKSNSLNCKLNLPKGVSVPGARVNEAVARWLGKRGCVARNVTPDGSVNVSDGTRSANSPFSSVIATNWPGCNWPGELVSKLSRITATTAPGTGFWNAVR